MENIKRILDNEVQKGKAPSAHYVFFNKDRILFEYATGYANLKTRMKTDVNTTFNAYSITKTFTALAILQLAERELISLDESVRKYLPASEISEKVTVRHLLTHTAGLANPLPLNWIHLASEHKTFSRNAFFKPILLKYHKSASVPGAKFKYTNLGYIILGQLIEAVTGNRYEDYIKVNIIDKLSLEPDFLGFEIPHPVLHATGYHNKRSLSMMLLGLLLNKSKYMDAPVGKWKPFKEIYLNGAPYGGLIGNIRGFVKYGQELLKDDNTLISKELKQFLFTENKTNDSKPTGMCLSWFKGKVAGYDYYTHAGGGGGYYGELRLYPDVKLGSFIIFNRSGFSDERYLDRVDVQCLKMM